MNTAKGELKQEGNRETTWWSLGVWFWLFGLELLVKPCLSEAPPSEKSQEQQVWLSENPRGLLFIEAADVLSVCGGKNVTTATDRWHKGHIYRPHTRIHTHTEVNMQCLQLRHAHHVEDLWSAVRCSSTRLTFRTYQINLYKTVRKHTHHIFGPDSYPVGYLGLTEKTQTFSEMFLIRRLNSSHKTGNTVPSVSVLA